MQHIKDDRPHRGTISPTVAGTFEQMFLVNGTSQAPKQEYDVQKKQDEHITVQQDKTSVQVQEDSDDGSASSKQKHTNSKQKLSHNVRRNLYPQTRSKSPSGTKRRGKSVERTSSVPRPRRRGNRRLLEQESRAARSLRTDSLTRSRRRERQRKEKMKHEKSKKQLKSFSDEEEETFGDNNTNTTNDAQSTAADSSFLTKDESKSSSDLFLNLKFLECTSPDAVCHSGTSRREEDSDSDSEDDCSLTSKKSNPKHLTPLTIRTDEKANEIWREATSSPVQNLKSPTSPPEVVRKTRIQKPVTSNTQITFKPWNANDPHRNMSRSSLQRPPVPFDDVSIHSDAVSETSTITASLYPASYGVMMPSSPPELKASRMQPSKFSFEDEDVVEEVLVVAEEEEEDEDLRYDDQDEIDVPHVSREQKPAIVAPASMEVKAKSLSSLLPKSPSILPKSPSILPKSPSPLPKSPSPLPKSPSPLPKSPSPLPKSPSPLPKSPSLLPKSPGTLPKSPSPVPESPSPVVNPLPKSSIQLPISPSSGAQTLPKSQSSGMHTLPKSPSQVFIQTPVAKPEILQPQAQTIPPKQHMTQVTQEIQPPKREKVVMARIEMDKKPSVLQTAQVIIAKEEPTKNTSPKKEKKRGIIQALFKKKKSVQVEQPVPILNKPPVTMEISEDGQLLQQSESEQALQDNDFSEQQKQVAVKRRAMLTKNTMSNIDGLLNYVDGNTKTIQVVTHNGENAFTDGKDLKKPKQQPQQRSKPTQKKTTTANSASQRPSSSSPEVQRRAPKPAKIDHPKYTDLMEEARKNGMNIPAPNNTATIGCPSFAIEEAHRKTIVWWDELSQKLRAASRESAESTQTTSKEDVNGKVDINSHVGESPRVIEEDDIFTRILQCVGNSCQYAFMSSYTFVNDCAESNFKNTEIRMNNDEGSSGWKHLITPNNSNSLRRMTQRRGSANI